MAEPEQQQQQQLKLEQLNAEKSDLESTHPLAAKLLEQEITRIQSGGLENMNFIELHQAKTKVEFRVKIPNKEFPQLNFVGKILGQGGENVKRLQEATGVRIAVLGWGSMKDKKKQEEYRAQGGKYAHLNHDLHVWFECQGHPIECYQKIANAFRLVHPFLTPDPNELMQIQQQQQNGGGMMRGGRGGPRGAPRGGPRGAMGGAPRGAMGGAMGRGGPPMRGAPAARGAPSQLMAGSYGGGGRPPMRGGPMSRGGRGAPMPGARGAGRGGMPSGRGGAPSSMGRGRGGTQSMLQPAYQSESYDYEPQTASGYGGGYGDEGNASYQDQMGMADPSYGVAPSDPNEQYQYEGYGQQEASGYGNYDMGGGWGGDAAADAGGYGKASAPTRGALSGYRARPY